MSTDGIPDQIINDQWAKWPWQRCPARTEKWEQCDLKRHSKDVDHALDHGLDVPRWSTRWTA